MVVTIPPIIDLTGDPGFPLISIPGFSVVVFLSGFHVRPNYFTTLPLAGQGNCPLSFPNTSVFNATCCFFIRSALS